MLTKPITIGFPRVLALVLTLAALLAGQGAPAQTPSTVPVRVSILGCFSSSHKEGMYIIGSNIASGRYEYPNRFYPNQNIPSGPYNLGNDEFPLTMTVTDGSISLPEGTSLTDVTTRKNITLTFTSSTKYILSASVAKNDGTAVEGCTVSGTYSKTVTVGIPKKTFGRVNLTMAVNTPLNFCTIGNIADTYIDDGVNRPVPTVTLDGRTLTQDVDYTVSYSFGPTGGTVTVTGIGKYIGSKSKNYKVRNPQLSDFTQLSDGAYQIATQRDLDYLARIVNSRNNCEGKTFRQTADIAFSHTTDWNYESEVLFSLDYPRDGFENNYTPIGGFGKSFRGHYDGGGHTISGIRIQKFNESENLGLFGYVSRGMVENVTLCDANINGENTLGGLVGYLDEGTVRNCLLYHVRLYAVQDKVGIIAGYQTSGNTISNIRYRDCQISQFDVALGTSFGGWGHEPACNLFAVTTGSGIAISGVTGETFVIDADTYYTAGTTVTLGYTGDVPDGYSITYSVNGSTIEGNTFVMPGKDVEVSVTLTPPANISLAANTAEGVSGYWTTFYCGIAGYSVADGVTIYKATVNGSGGVTLTPVDGGIIPMGNAVILKADASPIDLTITDDDEAGDYTGNELQGTDVAMANPGDAYVLSYKSSYGLGFYRLDASKSLAARKAYLTIGSEARGFYAMEEEVATRIDLSTPLNNPTEGEGAIFNLQGHRISVDSVSSASSVLPKGVYIVKGRKVIVR